MQKDMSDPSPMLDALRAHLSKLKQDPKVLVVDDDPDALKIAEIMLKRYNAKVSVCTDAQEARKLVRSGEFDVAFIDLRMPGNGAEQILRDASHPNTNVVVLTNFPEHGEVKGSLKTFDKPIRPEILDRFLAHR